MYIFIKFNKHPFSHFIDIYDFLGKTPKFYFARISEKSYFPLNQNPYHCLSKTPFDDLRTKSGRTPFWTIIPESLLSDILLTSENDKISLNCLNVETTRGRASLGRKEISFRCKWERRIQSKVRNPEHFPQVSDFVNDWSTTRAHLGLFFRPKFGTKPRIYIRDIWLNLCPPLSE